MPAATPLDARLLRKVEIRLDQPVKFPYAKVFALLAYLILEPGRQRRETLTELLWPRQDAATARANLRNAVHALRKQLGAARIGSDREHVWFAPARHDVIDLALLDRAPSADAAEAAYDLVASYAGELMPGFALPDAPAYMEWLDVKRLACHRQVLSLSEQLMRHDTAAGSPLRQIALARAQTLIDPWNEAFHLRLMRLLAEDGQGTTALAHYDYLRGLFRQELDSTPGQAIGELASQLRASPEPVAQAVPARASRARSLPTTLLCVDLHVLAQDPRDKLRLLQRARELAADEARRHGAHVCLTTDGHLLAYFGYPDSLPNACRRALRAAANLNRQAAQADVILRFALHHGPMVHSGEPARPDALGELSGSVARLAADGLPGEIRVSGAFAEKLGGLALIPLERALHIYPHVPLQAYRLAEAEVRPEAPLIGRDRERRSLLKLWHAAQRGNLQAALVAGPPGCGKSRLARWLVDAVTDPDQAVLLECRQALNEVPFAPFAERVKLESGIQPGDPQDSRSLKLDAWLDRRYPHLAGERRRMIGWLAGLPLDDQHASPAARRSCLHAALLDLLASRVSDGPLLVVVEDLHWADPSSLQFIESVLDSRRGIPCLLLFTARPPLADAWQADLPRIKPAPLTAAQSRRLIDALPGAPSGEQAIAEIVEHAGGNPLYIEALAHARGEPGLRPASLEDSLLPPLAQDAALRQVALGAAALGESFDLSLLRAVCPELSDGRFDAALRLLERHGLTEPAVGNIGRFHHALIRDTVYASAPPAERRRVHQLIQTTAPRQQPGLADERPHWLAHHAEQAGDRQGAADLLEHAARNDLAMAAHTEATRHFIAARDQLEHLPTSRDNDRRILRLILGEAHATVALFGYGATETRALYSQVLERSRHDDELDEVFLAHYGLWLGGSSHGGYQEALRHADKLQRIAEQTGAPLHRLQTAYAYGNTHLWLGHLADSRRHLESAVAIYHAERPADLLDQFHEDTGVISLSLLAWVNWLLGDSAAAEAAQAGAIDLARALRHPFSLCFALASAARLDLMRGRVDAVRRYGEELQAIASRQCFAIWEALAAVELGWVRCAEGDDVGLAMMDQGLAITALALPALEVTFLSMVADGLYRLGRPAACTEQIDHTLARAAHWQDHYMDAELLRMRAACATANGEAADAWLDRARSVATAQGAQAWLDRLVTPT